MTSEHIIRGVVNFLLLATVVQSLQSIVVQTNVGKLNGNIRNSPADRVRNPVIEFLNVRYGKVTLRFASSDNRVYDSKRSLNGDGRMGKVCYQSFPTKLDDSTMPTSKVLYLENLKKVLKNEPAADEGECLNMNIYVPQRAYDRRNRDGDKYATVVIIHGDSFNYGSGNAYDGSILAGYGEVIVVTLNFRLGVFGFLSDRQKENRIITGNAGISDIATALHLLRNRKLIQYLGGDIRKITLLGFGTGAAIAQHFLVSRYARAGDSQKQLFQRVILIGGSSYSSWGLARNGESYEILARNLSCTETDTITIISAPRIASCLRKKTVSQLKAAAQKVPNPLFLSTFGPTVDGSYVMHDPKKYNSEHFEQTARFDLLYGMNTNDGTDYFPQSFLAPGGGVDMTDRQNMIRTLVRNCFDYHRSEIFNIIDTFYLNTKGRTPSRSELTQDLLSIITEAIFTAPAQKTIDQHALYGKQNGKNTYLMNFFGYLDEMVDKNKRTIHPTRGGHLQEVPYILGYPLITRNSMKSPYQHIKFDEESINVSKQMMDIVAGFAKTGNPSQSLIDRGQSIIGDWLSYSSTDKRFLQMGSNTTSKRSGNPRVRMLAFYQPKMVLWNEVFPILDKPMKDGFDHHFLNANKDSFFGVKRPPRGKYFTAPIPPPPTAPPMKPDELKKLQEKQNADQNGSGSTDPDKTKAAGPSWSTGLGIVVAVGSAFLVLNLLICSVVYHTWEKKRRQSYKMQQQYAGTTGYDYRGGDNTTGMMMSTTGPSAIPVTNVGGSGFIMGAPPATASQGTSMPPPPPPPHLLAGTSGGAPSSGISAAGTAAGVMDSSDAELHPGMSGSLRSFHHHAHSHVHGPQSDVGPSSSAATAHLHNHQFAEQEPLLRNTISPMCPRHSKQAQMTTTRGMDEIQV